MGVSYQLLQDLNPEKYAELKDDIRERGVMVAVEYDEGGNVLDGHHRLRIVAELAEEGTVIEFPSVVRSGMTEAQKREHVIKVNSLRRQMTKAETAAAQRLLREDGASLPRIAEVTGTSYGTAWQNTRDVINADKVTGRDGKTYPARREPKPQATVAKPSVSSARGEVEEVQAPVAAAVPTFNRTNDNIEWARWSWNPVTGCLHDCPYCYARDIAVRFYPQGFKPTYHFDRLTAPRHTKLPAAAATDIGERNVFVCSMADLFGKWVPQEWIESILAEVRAAHQWNFLFLTKFPQRLAQIQFPPNAWVGTTVDTQARVKIAERAFRDVEAGVKFLSCEPMLERLTFSSLEMFDWLIIGGASASTQTPEYRPPFRDTAHLIAQADAVGLPVYMKTNLGIEDSIRLREYPGAVEEIGCAGLPFDLSLVE